MTPSERRLRRYRRELLAFAEETSRAVRSAGAEEQARRFAAKWRALRKRVVTVVETAGDPRVIPPQIEAIDGSTAAAVTNTGKNRLTFLRIVVTQLEFLARSLVGATETNPPPEFALTPEQGVRLAQATAPFTQVMFESYRAFHQGARDTLPGASGRRGPDNLLHRRLAAKLVQLGVSPGTRENYAFAARSHDDVLRTNYRLGVLAAIVVVAGRAGGARLPWLVPALPPGTMLRQADGIAVAAPPSQRADLLERLMTQIQHWMGPMWSFRRYARRDGSAVFTGGSAHVRIVDARGRLLRGRVTDVERASTGGRIEWEEGEEVTPDGSRPLSVDGAPASQRRARVKRS